MRRRIADARLPFLFWLIATMALAVPSAAQAQDVTTVRVLRAAAVLGEPQATADQVATVNPGEVLEVLDQREGWYLVRPPSGSAANWRTGWINAASVTPAAALAGPQQPQAAGPSRSANRRGFIFGLGAGGGLHRAPLVPGFPDAGTTSDGAVVTDLSIGYAPSDQVLIYYSNQVAWSRNLRYNIVGVTGMGVTYMVRPTAPSPFVRGSVGGGIAADVDFGSGSVSRDDTGLGLTLGGGYEFARHWSVEGGAMFVRLDNGRNHTVLKATLNWVFY
jgi:hypothetical protein